MTQRRTQQQTVVWAEKLQTWIALAVMFLAISSPQWVVALSGEKALAYVSATAFTFVAALFAAYACRRARRRSQR
ncbi:hypothetical protein [Kineococcus radiotolerans]|nr:hypothetical protein [Kineococcus radiotolerans]